MVYIFFFKNQFDNTYMLAKSFTSQVAHGDGAYLRFL